MWLPQQPGEARLTPDVYSEAFTTAHSDAMRYVGIHEGMRADGRGLGQVRPLECVLGVLPATHGSSLFDRGETQTMCSATVWRGQHAAARPPQCNHVGQFQC